MRTSVSFGIVRTLVAALVALAAAAAPALATQGSQGKWKWWQSDRIQAELGLTADQVSRIEEVFRSSIGELKAHKQELDRLEAELSTHIADATASESSVLQLIDRVEASRSALGRSRSLMLFRVHRVLTPDQRVRLKELHDRGELGAPGRGGERRR